MLSGFWSIAETTPQGLDDPVDYGLVVTLEVAPQMPVAVYEQVRQALRAAVPIRA